ncbi:MAG: hypothetical protein K1X67_04605 [Fimbriimonadaceae bacterium]|nr:hypothetical protein [Fimbriimonadaceae bacterium]
MPARLHLERTASRDVRCRFILVIIDGRQVASLNFGSQVDLDLAPGRHHIVFDNTWAKKEVDLDVAEGEIYAAQVGNTTSWLASLWMSVLAAFPTRIFLNILRVDPILPADDSERYLL